MVVQNPVASTTSAPATLRVTGATVYGLSGFRPVFAPGPNDLIGIRYRMQVVENQSRSLRLIFGVHRLHTPGSGITYIIESNIYSGSLSFADGGCTTWPLLGSYTEAQSSLRAAIPDYVFYYRQRSGLATGVVSAAPTQYSVQSYLIDNIPLLYKSDAISQASLNGVETLVTLERGETTSIVSAFGRCGRPLLPLLYRRWTMSIESAGRDPAVVHFVAPEANARFLSVNEAMGFLSEYLHGTGVFIVQLWDFEEKRESNPAWNSVLNFVTTSRYDGNGADFGVRVVELAGGQRRIEFSNVRGNSYLLAGTQFQR